MTDLWPKDIKKDVKFTAPVKILQEQGELLGRKTNDEIIGEVRKSPQHLGDFTFSFYIKSNKINYAYKLFSIGYEIMGYPVKFWIDDDVLKSEAHLDMFFNAKNETEYVDVLKKILGSDRTVTIINAMLAQGEVI